MKACHECKVEHGNFTSLCLYTARLSDGSFSTSHRQVMGACNALQHNTKLNLTLLICPLTNYIMYIHMSIFLHYVHSLPLFSHSTNIMYVYISVQCILFICIYVYILYFSDIFLSALYILFRWLVIMCHSVCWMKWCYIFMCLVSVPCGAVMLAAALTYPYRIKQTQPYFL